MSLRHCLFLCTGNQYWVFKETISLPGYPHPLSEWRMQTSDGRNVQRVEAAFVWARNGKTYLFSNGEFWGFDDERQIGRNMDGQYPRKTTLWKGVPSDPDGVISWRDGKTNNYDTKTRHSHWLTWGTLCIIIYKIIPLYLLFLMW